MSALTAGVGRARLAAVNRKKKRMYQPYPAAAEAAVGERPPAPSAVRYAAAIMYVGAGLSLIRVIADLATKATLKADITTKASHAAVPLTATEISTAVTTAIAASVVLGLIGAGLWILNARGSAGGRKWAQVTGTVLFGLDTLALLAGPPGSGVTGGQPAVDVLCTAAIWLAGLGAVVLLWRRSSRSFFNPGTP
jgi:hypothetical protein